MGKAIYQNTHWEPDIGKANKRARELEIMARCTPLLYDRKTESGILEEAVRIVGHEMGYPCAIMVPDSDCMCMKHMAAPETIQEILRAALGIDNKPIRIPAVQLNLYQNALHTHGPVYAPSIDVIAANDVGVQPGPWATVAKLLNRNMGNHGVGAICAPVFSGGQPLAVLYVFGPDMAEDDIPTIQHFTQIVASALQRLRDMETLEDSRRLLLLRNEIALAFLTGKGHGIYSRVLGILMNATQSWAGEFAYINETGDQVFPSCCVRPREPAQEPDTVVPRSQWGPLWEQAFIQQAPLIHNAPLTQDNLQNPLSRAVLIPIVFNNRPVGAFAVGNKDSDYTGEDILLAQSLTEFIAPLLFARLRAESLDDQRCEAEQALRDSESRYRDLYHKTPVMLHSIDTSGRLVSVSNFWLSTLGYSREEVIGRKSTDFLTAESRRYAEQIVIPEFFKTGFCQNVSYRFVKKNGEEIDTLLTAVGMSGPSGQIEKTLAVVTDITSLKQAESALRESEERFRLIADLSPFPVSIIDGKGTYEYINPRFTEVFGYPLERVPTGRAWFHLAFPDPEVRREAVNSWKENLSDASGHQIRPQIFTVTCSDASHRIVVFRPLLMKGGKVFVVYEDITERERAAAEKEALHKQLLHAQKMEAVGTLAGGIAHDFNNLLAVIIGNAQLATPGLKGHENAEEVEEILKAAQRARDLTMKLLSFSRKEKLNVRSTDLNSIVREIVSMIDRSLAGKIRLQTDLEDPLPPVRVDTNQIHQALLNICTNARDAMPHGGKLLIQTRSLSLDAEYCRKHPEASPGPHCLIQVTDTGEGMTDSVRDKMFEPFFTTKSDGKGTGLGLYVTYGIIKNHGGHLAVNTTPGNGAIVGIYLPQTTSSPDSAPPMSAHPDSRANRETVLVVDDEVSLLRLAEKMLLRAGYRPLTARSGPEALDIFRKHSREIDLVILDMIMPDMDGTDVYLALKALAPGVQVVLVSGYSVEGRASALMAQGVCGFVQKPFNFNDLIDTIRSVLDSKN